MEQMVYPWTTSPVSTFLLLPEAEGKVITFVFSSLSTSSRKLRSALWLLRLWGNGKGPSSHERHRVTHLKERKSALSPQGESLCHTVLWVFGKQERGFQGKIRVQFWDLSNLRFFTYPTTLWLQKSSKFSSPTKPEPLLVTNRKTNSKSSFTLSRSVKQIRREGATLF